MTLTKAGEPNRGRAQGHRDYHQFHRSLSRSCSPTGITRREIKKKNIMRILPRASVTAAVSQHSHGDSSARSSRSCPSKHGGERASFSSLRAKDAESAILNLEQGDSVPQWGRLIFHVADVDAFWTHLREKGFDPGIPRDASWGERYFHMPDPDGHELSFARPLQ